MQAVIVKMVKMIVTNIACSMFTEYTRASCKDDVFRPDSPRFYSR